ncbi:MAG TPA: hypothetical protein VGC80_08355 [Acetobacteraceae bacterium]
MVGLIAEGRIARRLGTVEIGGGLPAGAEAAAERLVASGATSLLSFGLAGGLNSDLDAGTILVPPVVKEAGMTYEADAELAAWLGGFTSGPILAGAAIVASTAEKQRLWQSMRADAVDLESGAVARVARRRGIPFAVLRAICDPAGRDLPPAALVALDQSGAIGLLRVLGAVLRRPGQIPALLTLASDAARARRALVDRVARLNSRAVSS